MRNAIASLLMGGIFLAGQGPLIAVEAGKQAPCQIIPRPQRAEYLDGGYQLTERTVIYARSDKLKATAQYLAELLRPATGLNLKVASPRSMPSGGVVLKLDDSRVDLGEEGYLLHCTPKGVTITAANPSGVFYGVQTLRQLLPPEIEGRQTVEGRKWIVPSVSIEDRPRFKWRGYMLDPGPALSNEGGLEALYRSNGAPEIEHPPTPSDRRSGMADRDQEVSQADRSGFSVESQPQIRRRLVLLASRHQGSRGIRDEQACHGCA